MAGWYERARDEEEHVKVKRVGAMMILLFVKSDSIQHSKSKIMNDHSSVNGGASDTGKS